MLSATDRQVRTELGLGFRVDRATAALPQSTAEALFTVAGGGCLVTLLLGEVTTVIQTQACNTKLTVNPTAGTSGDVASVLDITADEVGTLYFPEGDGTALVGVNAGTGFTAGVKQPFIVPVGTIDLDCAASNTGAVKWSIFYVPLDAGAVIAAA